MLESVWVLGAGASTCCWVRPDPDNAIHARNEAVTSIEGRTTAVEYDLPLRYFARERTASRIFCARWMALSEGAHGVRRSADFDCSPRLAPRSLPQLRVAASFRPGT